MFNMHKQGTASMRTAGRQAAAVSMTLRNLESGQELKPITRHRRASLNLCSSSWWGGQIEQSRAEQTAVDSDSRSFRSGHA